MRKKSVLLSILVCLVLLMSACAGTGANGNSQALPVEDALLPLPPSERDGWPFGVDVNINMSTIDDWIERPDVVYRDLRMFFDPAGFGAIGGISNLTQTLPGYLVVPMPYLVTLTAMPVEGQYEGPVLFDAVWGDNNDVLSIKANYVESEMILDDLFPKDKVIFLMCGGAGYSALTRGLLVYMGWDEDLIYSTGGNWYYEGGKAVDLTVEQEGIGEEFILATWRVNYAYIDFDRLHPVTP